MAINGHEKCCYHTNKNMTRETHIHLPLLSPLPVLGVVSPDNLGVTLPHEHLLVDFRIGILPPPPGRDGDLPFSLRNLGYIRRFP